MYNIDASNTTLDNVGSADFNAKFWSSESRLLKRICSTCSPEYREIYYARNVYEKEYSIDVYEELIGSFMPTVKSSDNFDSLEMFQNFGFNLFSTLEDAIERQNPWNYCNGGVEQVRFPSRCGVQSKWAGDIIETTGTRYEWALYKARGICTLGDAINKTRTKCNAACTTFLKEGTGTPFRPSSMRFSTLTACKRYCKGWRYVALTRSKGSCDVANTFDCACLSQLEWEDKMRDAECARTTNTLTNHALKAPNGWNEGSYSGSTNAGHPSCSTALASPGRILNSSAWCLDPADPTLIIDLGDVATVYGVYITGDQLGNYVTNFTVKGKNTVFGEWSTIECDEQSKLGDFVLEIPTVTFWKCLVFRTCTI